MYTYVYMLHVCDGICIYSRRVRTPHLSTESQREILPLPDDLRHAQDMGAAVSEFREMGSFRAGVSSKSEALSVLTWLPQSGRFCHPTFY